MRMELNNRWLSTMCMLTFLLIQLFPVAQASATESCQPTRRTKVSFSEGSSLTLHAWEPSAGGMWWRYCKTVDGKEQLKRESFVWPGGKPQMLIVDIHPDQAISSVSADGGTISFPVTLVSTIFQSGDWATRVELVNSRLICRKAGDDLSVIRETCTLEYRQHVRPGMWVLTCFTFGIPFFAFWWYCGGSIFHRCCPYSCRSAYWDWKGRREPKARMTVSAHHPTANGGGNGYEYRFSKPPTTTGGAAIAAEEEGQGGRGEGREGQGGEGDNVEFEGPHESTDGSLLTQPRLNGNGEVTPALYAAPTYARPPSSGNGGPVPAFSGKGHRLGDTTSNQPKGKKKREEGEPGEEQ